MTTTTIPQQNVTPQQGFMPSGWQGMPWNPGYPQGVIPGMQPGQPVNGTNKSPTDQIPQGVPFNPFGMGMPNFAGPPVQNLTQASGQPTSLFGATPFGFNPYFATPTGFGQTFGQFQGGQPPTGFNPIGFNNPSFNSHFFNSQAFNTPFGFSNSTQPWNSIFGCSDPSCFSGFGSFGPDFSSTYTSNFANTFNPSFGHTPFQSWQNGTFNSPWQNSNTWQFNSPWQHNSPGQNSGPWNSFGFNGFNQNQPFFGTPWNGSQNSQNFGPTQFGFQNSNNFATPFGGFNTPFNSQFGGFSPQQFINQTPIGSSVPFGQFNTPSFNNWQSPIGYQQPFGCSPFPSPFGFANPGFNTPFQQGMTPFGAIPGFGYNPYFANQTNTTCDTNNTGGLNLNNQAA